MDSFGHSTVWTFESKNPSCSDLFKIHSLFCYKTVNLSTYNSDLINALFRFKMLYQQQQNKLDDPCPCQWSINRLSGSESRQTRLPLLLLKLKIGNYKIGISTTLKHCPGVTSRLAKLVQEGAKGMGTFCRFAKLVSHVMPSANIFHFFRLYVILFKNINLLNDKF